MLLLSVLNLYACMVRWLDWQKNGFILEICSWKFRAQDWVCWCAVVLGRFRHRVVQKILTPIWTSNILYYRVILSTSVLMKMWKECQLLDKVSGLCYLVFVVNDILSMKMLIRGWIFSTRVKNVICISSCIFWHAIYQFSEII